jgi:hypothetical protein
MLQAFDVDLLPYSKRIELDLLVEATRSIKSFGLLSLEHILQIFYLFRVK